MNNIYYVDVYTYSIIIYNLLYPTVLYVCTIGDFFQYSFFRTLNTDYRKYQPLTTINIININIMCSLNTIYNKKSL